MSEDLAESLGSRGMNAPGIVQQRNWSCASWRALWDGDWFSNEAANHRGVKVPTQQRPWKWKHRRHAEDAANKRWELN